MRILKENTAGVLIDLQERLFPHIYENDQLLKNCIKLIEGFRMLEIPVIVSQQYSKGLGQTLPSITAKFAEFSFIEKSSFSCTDEPVFMDKLQNLNRKNLLLFGIETHVCVLQTAIDILKKDFCPVIITDCVGSRNLYDKTIALERLKQEGALVTTLESILLELARYAGNERFKTISALIK